MFFHLQLEQHLVFKVVNILFLKKCFFQALDPESCGNSGKQNWPRKRSKADEIYFKRKPTYEWGWVDIDQFAQKMSHEGIHDAKIDHGSPGYIIHLVIVCF